MIDFHDLFRQLAGEPIPGGCEYCDADRLLDELGPGMHVLTIRHDDDCPFLRSRKAKAN